MFTFTASLLTIFVVTCKPSKPSIKHALRYQVPRALFPSPLTPRQSQKQKRSLPISMVVPSSRSAKPHLYITFSTMSSTISIGNESDTISSPDTVACTWPSARTLSTRVLEHCHRRTCAGLRSRTSVLVYQHAAAQAE